MFIDPMEMKKTMIENAISDLNSGDKKKQLSGIEFLSKTIGIGQDFGLENTVIDALFKLSLTSKNRRVKKAAAKAETEIKYRIAEKSNANPVADMLGMFSGGVGFISTKGKKK